MYAFLVPVPSSLQDTDGIECNEPVALEASLMGLSLDLACSTR